MESINDLKALDFDRHRRRIWKPFMEKHNIQKLAEIGVFEGKNFKNMIEHNPNLAVGVDAWIDDGIIARNDCGYPQEQLNDMYAKVVSDNRKESIKIIREYTTEASKYFLDEYFDLIYIDADHTYEGCKRDIEAWYPKVKKGGFITGDDYSHHTTPRTGVKFGVIQAVNEFFKDKEIHELPSHGWAVIK